MVQTGGPLSMGLCLPLSIHSELLFFFGALWYYERGEDLAEKTVQEKNRPTISLLVSKTVERHGSVICPSQE